MYFIWRAIVVVFLFVCAFAGAAEIAPQRLQITRASDADKSACYWTSSPVANTSQLLTLFCRGCVFHNNTWEDLPLVSVLRDTLGDNSPENDRIMYVWLLSSSRLGVGQKILSAVPFFYWRIGDGSKSVSPRDLTPLINLNAPQHPAMSAMSRNLVQWTALDPLTKEVRATSRSFWANQVDYERLHIEAAISYLRKAPVSNDSSALTAGELNTVIARLELRKTMLGGLADDSHAARFGEENSFEDERIRSRNWEVLRQFAEKTGLYFEPISLAGSKDQHGMLWFPLDGSLPQSGASLKPIWKILNIKDPWADRQLHGQNNRAYVRALDENGVLLPQGESGAKQIKLFPLSVYSLNYPKQPLLLVDFRDKLRVRRYEMAQRTVNEITSGVIGLSHFTNWYYYVGAMAYNMLWSRRGIAVDQEARLDCYSQFRTELALDHQLAPALRRELQSRAESLAVNPLAASANREIQAARAHYAQLQSQSEEGSKLAERLEKERRAELADFGESTKANVTHNVLHMTTLGLYTHRVKPEQFTLAALDSERRIRYHLGFLDAVVKNGTEPEIAFDSLQIQSSVVQLRELVSGVDSPQTKAHAVATLERLKSLSRDQTLQADCALAIIAFRQSPELDRIGSGPVVAGSVRATAKGVESLK